MHNLHFIVVRADSAKEAADDVSSEIINWGNEDNWRSIGGIASENALDDIENLEDARWGLSFLDETDESDKQESYFKRTLAYHLSIIQPPIILKYYPNAEYTDLPSAIKAVAGELVNFDCASSAEHELWVASQSLKHLYELFSAQQMIEAGSELPELYRWEFDCVGLTDMTASTDGKQRYIVFLDMHS